MIFTMAISTQDLATQYQPTTWVLIDCRFDLVNPNWGYQNYLKNHIPGSIFADLNHDLSAPISIQTGRHPLPQPRNFIEKLASWGIKPGIQVVAIDTSNGTFAARVWWMLRAVGHTQVAVLDGGYNKWLRENRPTKYGSEVSEPTPFRYPTEFLHQPYKTTNDIINLLTESTYLLLDARSAERYRGEIEPIDLIAGRIPGALNRPTSENLLPDGTLKPAVVLREEILGLLHGTPPDHVVAYCGSGVTSCHLILAMEVAGLQGAFLYPGSWSEWIRDPDRLIERG